ncbi:MAG: hypothetical protein AAFQ94_25160, partial [Bacteroidota bacterium]
NNSWVYFSTKKPLNPVVSFENPNSWKARRKRWNEFVEQRMRLYEPDPEAPFAASGVFLSLGAKSSVGGVTVETEVIGLQSNGTVSNFVEVQSNTFDLSEKLLGFATKPASVIEGGFIFIFDDGKVKDILNPKTGFTSDGIIPVAENLFRIDLGAGFNLMIEYNATAKELKVGFSVGKPGVAVTTAVKSEVVRFTTAIDSN